MIQAREAYKRAENAAAINKIISDCENEITRAIENGKFRCTVKIRNDTNDDIRRIVCEKLAENGYKHELKGYEKPPGFVPAEQWGFYDDLKISWEENHG